jgi:NDP-sugar pyrophosphorylase family protein
VDLIEKAAVVRALLLAAGNSTRIRSVAGDLPKPLLEIGGRTVLEHNLRWIADSGVTDLSINVHYQPEMIIELAGDGHRFGLNITYQREDQLKGTAGAWKIFNPAQTSLVVYGDNLTRFDLSAMLKHHRQHKALATIALFDQNVQPNTGIAGGRVILNDDSSVNSFVEGGTQGLVNAGVYLLEPELLDHIPVECPYDFARELFPLLLEKRLPLTGFKFDGFCLGLDTPETLVRARGLLNSGKVSLE